MTDSAYLKKDRTRLHVTFCDQRDDPFTGVPMKVMQTDASGRQPARRDSAANPPAVTR